MKLKRPASFVSAGLFCSYSLNQNLGEGMVSKINKDQELQKRAINLIEHSGGIQAPFRMFYYHSIFYSAKQCMAAFERYDVGKQNLDVNILVGEIQEAIGHAAALSRYFWSNKESKKPAESLIVQRGKTLRAEFELSDDSELKNRDLRNAWEHFDERLDEYLIQDISGCLFPDCIQNTHILADEPIAHIFKLLDVENECLVLLNEKYFFAPIKAEVERILKKAETLIQ